MPKISVIIPVYGVENYIEKCADSLFQQSLGGIEYIFVDDCTPDRSIELLERKIEEYRLRFAKEGKVVRIVRMPTNSGLPAVRRAGLQLATGEYVIYCDSDDWIYNVDAYKDLYTRAVAGDYDIVYFDFLQGDGNTTLRRRSSGQLNLRKILLHQEAASLCNKLIKRSIFISNEILYPKNNMGEDIALTSQVLFFSKRICYVPQGYYYYYNNCASITRHTSKEKSISRYRDLMANIDLIELFLKNNDTVDLYLYEIGKLREDACDHLLSFIGNKDVKDLWVKSNPSISFYLKYCPKEFKSLLRYLVIFSGLYLPLKQVIFKKKSL